MDRLCLDCTTSLEGEHGSRKRCAPCSKAKQLNYIRDWQWANKDKVAKYDAATYKRKMQKLSAERAANPGFCKQCNFPFKVWSQATLCECCRVKNVRATRLKATRKLNSRCAAAKPKTKGKNGKIADVSVVIDLRRQKLSYQKIGESVGVTRERVRQLLEANAPELCGPL